MHTHITTAERNEAHKNALNDFMSATVVMLPVVFVVTKVK
jgi:hypothetical protein